MKYPYVRQHDQNDCGAACMAMVAAYYGLKMPLGKYRELIKTDSAGSTIYGIIDGAQKIGFEASGLKGTYAELLQEYKDKKIKLPVIAHIIKEDGMKHFIVIYEIKEKYVKIGDPSTDIMKMPMELFVERWTGYIITFEVTETFQKANMNKNSMERYIDVIEEQKWALILIVVISLIIAGINMYGTALFEYIVDGLYAPDVQMGSVMNDNGILKLFFKKIPAFGLMCICVIALYIFQMFIQYGRSVISIQISKKINLPIILKYYTKITRLPISFFSGRKTGDLLTRFNDASHVCQMIVDMIFTVIIDGLLAVFYAVFMVSINPILFFIALVILLLYTVIVFCFRKTIRNMEMSVMEKNADVNSYLKESIQGMETIKAYGIEKKVRRKTFALVSDYVNDSCRTEKIAALQDNLIGCITSVGIVVLLWVGVLLCNKEILTTGTLITFYAVLGCFLTPMQNIIGLQAEIQSAFIAAERLNDVMELRVEDEGVNEDTDQTEIGLGDIFVHNVTFRYGARNVILENCNLTIKRNSCVALIGESGCGKSTLAKLLVGFYEPEKGDIKIGDKNLKEVSKRKIREKITYISQDTFLFSDSIRNNLFCDEAVSEKVMDNMNWKNKMLKDLPYGLDTMVEENGANLSGGQKQQIAFLRSFLRDTEILILDETSSNLDSITEKSIRQMIDAHRNKMTIIIIAHRLTSVVDCDKIFFMGNGKIEAEGTHDELLKKSNRYKKLWDAYIK